MSSVKQSSESLSWKSISPPAKKSGIAFAAFAVITAVGVGLAFGTTGHAQLLGTVTAFVGGGCMSVTAVAAYILSKQPRIDKKDQE